MKRIVMAFLEVRGKTVCKPDTVMRDAVKYTRFVFSFSHSCIIAWILHVCFSHLVNYIIHIMSSLFASTINRFKQ